MRIFTLALLLGSMPPAHAFHFPWDQGHDTTLPLEVSDPPKEPCNGAGGRGSPVYLKSGQLVWVETDVALRGRPALRLDRSYHSLDPKDGMFGRGWTADCEPTLLRTAAVVREADGSTRPVYRWALRLPDGRRFEFEQQADGQFQAPPGMRATLEPLADGGVRLRARDGSFHEFDGGGRLRLRQDRNGNPIRYQYRDGRLQQLADVHGRYLAFTYNAAGRVGSVQDHSGRLWRYDYDSEGNLIAVTDPLGGVRRYEYRNWQAPGDSQVYSQLSRVTDASGVVVIEVEYADGKVASYTEGANRYSYRYEGDIVSKRDALGSLWRYRLNAHGLYTELSAPAGRVTRFDYNDAQQLTRHVDAEGLVTQYQYDAQQRLLSRDRGGAVTRYTYDGDQIWPVQLVSPTGLGTHLSYDAHGNPLEIVTPQQGSWRLSWSAQGDLLGLTDAGGSRWSLRYNAIGQLISITNPLGQREQYQYDTRGNLLRYTDALGRGHQFEYDLLDRLQAHIDPLQARTEYHYDAAGRLTQLIAANGASVRYEYDGQGRLAAYTHFDGQTETYSYHPDNTLARWQHPSGARREFAYDAAKRVIRMVTNDDEYVYGYNRRDQRVLARNAAGAIEWAYDTRGRLQREQAQGFATEFGYDDEDRLVTENLLGELRRYSYDNRGLPARIQTPAGDVTLRHDARGRLSERQLPNGLVLRYEYDAAGRLTQLSHGGLAQYHYGYDATGQIIQWTGDGAPRRYQYDAAGRLTQVLGGVTETFVYDRMGNRMNAGARFDAANRLLEDDEYRYDYDARGNRSLRESRHSGVREVYRYNALNQLVSYEVYPSPQGPEPQRSTRYGYDAMGRRWVKEDSLAGRSEYLWVGAGLAAEHRAGTIVRLYGGEYQRLGLDYHWAHEDHLGTLQMLSDGAGRLAWSGEHLAYGGLRSQTGEVEQPLRFPGQYADAESGLHQNYFRDYDPQRGIYLQSDPIGLAGGINTYAYVMGNPVGAVDSLGLETCLLTTVGPAGVRDHSAVYTAGGDNGEPALYDPAGSYGAANGGGSSGLVTGDAASIAKFKAFHEGQKVESTCKNTSQEEEESIIKKAVNLPAAAPFQCAVMSSSALSGQPSFPHVEAGTFWPGNLLRQFRKGP